MPIDPLAQVPLADGELTQANDLSLYAPKGSPPLLLHELPFIHTLIDRFPMSAYIKT
jgi:hypothetical protein